MAKLIYVLLDGVGDLPHRVLNHLTPLEAAYTPNLDVLARNGAMGVVHSMGRGIAPESDIAVLSMLGYKFRHEDYAGRGVIEALGAGIDFRDGNLAMRGNFATVDNRLRIIDRRAGRSVQKEEAEELVRAVRDGVNLSKGSFDLVHTTGHRVVLCVGTEDDGLSADISNTDPAYARVKGMGVAKPAGAKLRLEECRPLKKDASSRLAAKLVNEFTKKSLNVLRDHTVNRYRRSAGKMEANCILLRDAGNRIPTLAPISQMHGLRFCCIVDMPVERGIAKVTEMPALEAGGIMDYEQKAGVAARSLGQYDAVYVHIKGPDEFGHDGDAKGKKRSIEEIDSRFFGPLLGAINLDDIAVVVSGDHATPCIKFGHSADPVPLLVSWKTLKNKDNLARLTESHASKGSLGRLDGYEVMPAALRLIRS